MKKIIIKLFLAVFICFIHINTKAQQVVAERTKPAIKSFIITAETAKDLQGVNFINNKLTAKPGYKFEQLPNDGGVRVIEIQNAKQVIGGTYICYCSSGSCSVMIVGNSLECKGDICCKLGTTVNEPPKKNIKKSNALKNSEQIQVQQK